mgnify:CR=1 FL=1
MRPVKYDVTSADGKFQSTHPRGVRLPVGDQKTGLVISIHAPARGATGRLFFSGCPLFISIHAPARGATRHATGLSTPHGISIHAPARGATVFLVLPDTLGPIAVVPRTALAIEDFSRFCNHVQLHHLISLHCEPLQ